VVGLVSCVDIAILMDIVVLDILDSQGIIVSIKCSYDLGALCKWTLLNPLSVLVKELL